MFFVFFFDVERGERAWSASELPDAAVAGEQARDEKPMGRKGPSSKAPSRGGAAAEAGSAAVLIFSLELSDAAAAGKVGSNG